MGSAVACPQHLADRTYQLVNPFVGLAQALVRSAKALVGLAEPLFGFDLGLRKQDEYIVQLGLFFSKDLDQSFNPLYAGAQLFGHIEMAVN